ncbi:MAG TPA: methylated-DNA--protein-cysteine methyltransferase [Gammaproteobacteria bacterium]|jgi:methylated-DNA-[protein]-cysteine S-methyltransferase|nr:methylated-DNA--protein-cysteine methyltransferase [Gammaproteobacteria bacterium]
MQQLYYSEIDSPIGDIAVYTDGDTLVHLDFTDCPERITRLLRRRFGEVTCQTRVDPVPAVARLAAYFEGDSQAFEDITFATGGTVFQQRVWRALCEIPFGQTRSYSQLAKAIGQPTAVRAVASANANNPIGLIVPCHRVIASNGSLAGYAGGVHRKAWLLQHEEKALHQRAH